MEASGWWHAVGKDKHGASGVFSSWTEASILVLGTSGAVFKKFRDCDKSVEFVKTCRVPEPKNAVENQEVLKCPPLSQSGMPWQRGSMESATSSSCGRQRSSLFWAPLVEKFKT
jgi:hypothetical protein